MSLGGHGGAGRPGGQNDHPAARASVVVDCLGQDGPGRPVRGGLVRRDPHRRSVLAWVDVGPELRAVLRSEAWQMRWWGLSWSRQHLAGLGRGTTIRVVT